MAKNAGFDSRSRPQLADQLGRISARVIAILLALCCFVPARAEKIDGLTPAGYVNDFAGVLDAQVEAQINALCAEVDQKARAQITVVTIHSLDGLAPEEFGNKLFERWGVGYRDDNRGVLLLLAVTDRNYWIEVGYGLEPILPDGKVGGFGREMVPKLRQGEYGAAMLLLTARIAEVIARDREISLTIPLSDAGVGTRSAQPASARSDQLPFPGGSLALAGAFILLLFLLFLGFGFLRVAGTGNLLELLILGLLLGAGRRSGHGRFGGGFGGFGGGGGFGGFGGGASGGGGAGGSW